MNAINDFAEFCRALGLRPGVIVPDGKWRRCPTEGKPRKKNGAYKLSPDGRIGWARDHAAHSAAVTWRPEGETHLPAPPDPAMVRRYQRERREERLQAIRGAREFYDRCSALVGGHEYLTGKGLDMTGCRGLRVDRRGNLVVPMLRDEALLSVQRIMPDGTKLFWKNAPSKGTSYVLERRGAILTVLCEGLATGLAIFAALPTARVVVAFTSGNLPVVAEQIPRRGMAVVAGDNDHQTVCQRHQKEGLEVPFEPWAERPEWCRCNPGRCAAAEAAALLGCGYAVPEGVEGTDWCDFRQERLSLRLERPLYGRRREPEGVAQRAVDGEIASLVMRAARFLPLAV